MKYIKILLVLVILSVALVGCSTESTPPVESPVEELVLTVDELSEFNGEDGKPAYVAVDGVIYDVTNVSFWAGGEHNGFTAGSDLTEEIKNVSPHGVSKLDGVPVVGKLSN